LKTCTKCKKEFDEEENFSIKATVDKEEHWFCSLKCVDMWVDDIARKAPSCKTRRCVHQRGIPGDCHIECAYPIIKDNITELFSDVFRILDGRGGPRCTLNSIMKQMGVRGDETGIKNGWFNWPFNFDPMWLICCAKFEEA